MPATWLQRRSTLAFLATCVALFDFYPGDYPVRGQAEAFTWPLVGGILAIGFAGLLAERASGFPDAFADPRRERSGWILAASAGVAYGLLTAARDYFIDGGGNVLTLSDWAHVPWPWSVPFYTFGAIFLELLLRLGALCLFVWLIHVVILRRRWRMPVFWTVNLIVSCYEIMPMTMGHARAGEWAAVAAAPIEPLYWTNVFEGWLLLRFGWFAPIVFRLAFYLVWHVAYGGLGPF
jgi:hypothetical protein